MKEENHENEQGYWASVFNFGRVVIASLDRKHIVYKNWRRNYQDYIKSTPWKIKSKEAKKRAEYRCQLCYSDQNLATHHRTYERLGNEDDGDLVVLCAACHKKFHSKLKLKIG